MELPSLIAFGAVSPWPGAEKLGLLRDALLQLEALGPVIKALEELPSLWTELSKQDPSLNSIPGEAAAEHLSQWAAGKRSPELVEEKGNTMRMSLTITAQIMYYVRYLHQHDEPLRHESLLERAAAGGGVQGFCIGLLNAVAVASAKTESEVGEFAAVSVRLAFCIGAYVDLDRSRNEGASKASTLAVRWKTPMTLEDIQSLLSKHPDTYISVVRDVRDVTITVSGSVVERLLEELTQVGASARDTGVSGRFHNALFQGIPHKILETCQAHYDPSFNGHCLVRSNTNSQLFPGGDIALLALESILVERAEWYTTMSASTSLMTTQTSTNPFILSIGNDPVPSSISKVFPVVKPIFLTDKNIQKLKTSAASPPHAPSVMPGYPEDAIAIIGMGCKWPGANSVDEFWDLLTDGKSMLSEVPEGRFGKSRPARSPNNLRYWGNFLRDIEAWDHGFFKKSSREALSMDPQQRILLQIAYEALESSGYFSDPSKPEDVGCYIGACAVDYDFNVASHPPSAYSATGTLRSFVSGKLSHYFGWSGPSLVLDTACSSSAVAIHTACTALRTGQCSQALAGGITLMTSPYLFENFSTAHFLSPTGGSKPFSADADGYCRGEGGGLVVLKRLSDAIRDHDHVISVIAGSAVNQNDNCVPITVPHTSSQGNLYEKVTKQAGVTPQKVSFVEAHGTGTPVGDPIEMESIRRVFGAADRDIPLIVSSAKGNIGHTEGASGVAALIKAILQMENRLAPRQALFKSLNPKIPALEPDRLCIPTSNVALSGDRLAACVNNYGAAGSNAAMILLEAPRSDTIRSLSSKMSKPVRSIKHPIQLAAASTNSLLAYCRILDDFCGQLRSARNIPDQSQILSNLAFSLSARLNQQLSFTLTTSATDVDQLQAHLRQQSPSSNMIKPRPKQPPVVLCFGGQVSDKVALDKVLWEESTLLRSHMDICDNALREMGYPGIYPAVFQPEPVTNVVVLHSILFATQYACAKAWLESGLKVDALVGHSFGQLTAMCLSGMLSLSDGLKLVAGRASLMQKHWGPESGTMIAIETDRKTLEEVQRATLASGKDQAFEIACFNGTTSHVAVSDKASAADLETQLVERSIRYRKLDVPYGFHSRFTEPLLPQLEDLASSLTFHEPTIPLETCTANESWAEPTAKLITAHTREPVFFGEAIQRLQTRLGPCTWLEAGTDSSITGMVRRAVGQASATANNFVPMQLSKSSAIDLVSDATVALWNAGHRVHFWGYHKLQKPQYDHLRLPPYAWEKSKHWLELDMSKALGANDQPSASLSTEKAVQEKLPPVLLRLKSSDSRGHQFHVDPSSEEYQAIVKDLRSSGSASSPPALYIELATRALRTVSDLGDGVLLSLQNLKVHSLLGLSLHETITLDLQQLAEGWKFTISSPDGSQKGANCAAEGVVNLKAPDSRLDDEFSRYERLTSHDQNSAIVDDPRSESLRGKVMYKMLSRANDYPDWYRAVKSVAAMESRVMAKVGRPAGIPAIISKHATSPHILLESFLQVAGVHANCLHECAGGEIFHFSKIDHLQAAPGFNPHAHTEPRTMSWDVVAYTSMNAGQIAYDMFVYDATTSRLVVLLLGVHYTSLRQPVTISTSHDMTPAPAQAIPTVTNTKQERVEVGPIGQPSVESQAQTETTRPSKDAKQCIYEDICVLVEKLADIPEDQVAGDKSFDDVGVDSLMMIEVISELSSLYKADLPIDELEQLTDIDSLVNYLHSKGCVSSSYVEGDDSASSGSSSLSASTAVSTPPDSGSEDSAATKSNSAAPRGDYLDSKSIKPQARAVAAVQDGKILPPLDMGPFGLQSVFERLRFDFEKHAEQTGAKGFWTDVYPEQEDLVCSYIIDAYRKLGCDLPNLAAGQPLPSMNTLPKHKHLVRQMRRILADSGFLELGDTEEYIRTSKTFNVTSTTTKYERMLRKHPLYHYDTKLLNATGAHLAECLMGKKEPLSMLFGDKQNRELLAGFYAGNQMLRAATHLLVEFVGSTFSATQSDGTLSILEVGAGTGGTTKYIVEHLTRCGVSFEYYFTDISQSLVNQAKRNFASYPQMKFMTFDCDKPAPPDLHNKFHLVISTNCIHATGNITTSTTNILPVIREDGALCVLEFTRILYWFDLVFGLLEGWWLFSDGRQHALASESFWDKSMRAAGYKHVSWTDGATDEAKTLRLVCAFKGAAAKKEQTSAPSSSGTVVKRSGVPMEEIVWKQIGDLALSADVYYPKTPDPPGKKRPIALLIHGGGHFLFGRKDVPMKHIRTLIDRGYLPVSTDYRLVPETNLFEGPMTDCCDALKWATETLPTLSLAGPTVVPDPSKVLSIGWSSGGQLSMSLGYTAPERGIKPPDVVLAMYPPSDMESDHWHKPCYPLAAEEEPQDVQNILEGVKDSPIIEYAPLSNKRTFSLSLTLTDPRARIILHMCWNSCTIPYLVNRLPTLLSSDSSQPPTLPEATPDQLHRISPLHHIRAGTYKTPTFIIHGSADDWLPLSMSERTVEAMRENGVKCGFSVPDQCRHAFDLFPMGDGDPLNVGWAAVEEGYEFVGKVLGV